MKKFFRIIATILTSIVLFSCEDGVKGAIDRIVPSSEGREFYAVITPTIVDSSFSFALVISNGNPSEVHYTVSADDTVITTGSVPSKGSAVVDLPWVASLKDCTTASALVAKGAYRVTTDQAVTVHQYSPLEYTDGINYSSTNDATLLFPVNAWDDEYVVVARNTWRYDATTWYPGFYTVVASEDNTTISTDPSGTGGRVLPGGGIPSSGNATIVINSGDVLVVLSDIGGSSPDVSDLTGTRIIADKPVQVISGHVITNIPHSTEYADHIEESMIPVKTAGTRYVIAPPLIDTSTVNAQNVRIVALEDNTNISFSPSQPAAPSSLSQAGAYFELDNTDQAFVATSDKPVLVVQNMLGQSAGGGSGDPAFVLLSPVSQYRTQYFFCAPTNYESNFITITCRSGANVSLDDFTVTGFGAIGSTGYSFVSVQLAHSVNGCHKIESDEPIGITVYGYGQYTSYWVLGGINLERINE